MISDQELLHGAAILRLVESVPGVHVAHAPNIHESVYLVEIHGSKAAFLLKLSKRGKSPWPFAFSVQEAQAFCLIRREHPDRKFFFGLVCNKDGICCLTERELAEVASIEDGIAGLRVSIARRDHGSYHMTGPQRISLSRAVQVQGWPKRITDAEG